ncbi:DsbA family protein [Photobacterium galatheae]|uniref:DSBA-like thioredoxin domain-containing protein n=1 Tax=Photobacterium galatheae TaxID=1654360 RepID=A0A066RX60_9GAMM|nr:DsbA family protein [Photobacterium galatheae]KDM92257.1 hypothetical protein EA58_07135 [Photobacterium galatheae]MCM0150562.1 DsbA family protein [Photobacterium galatheae]
MVSTVLNVHYFFDPLCGWCFGASPLIDHLIQRDDIQLNLHPGGLFNSRTLSPETRQHFLESDQKIHSMSGVEFGAAYQAKMRDADSVVLDSMLPIRAVLAAEQCGYAATEMLKRIQLAHYQQGKTVHEIEVLTSLAADIGIPADIWNDVFAQTDEQSDIASTTNLMLKQHLRGYPSMTVEIDGQWISVPVQSYFGNLKAWETFWNQLSR